MLIGNGQIVFLRGVDTLLELFRAEQLNPLRPAEGDGYPWSGVRNFSFAVDDVDGKIAEMGTDAIVTVGPRDFNTVIPGWKSAWLRNPTGSVIQITQSYIDQDNPPALPPT